MDPLYFALLLYVAALALAAVDLLVPSGGLLAVMAALAAFASILFGFRSSTTAGMAMLTVVIASIPVFLILAIKIWPHTPLGRRIILKLPNRVDSKPQAHSDALKSLVGRVLLSETGLMPMGQIRIGHRRYDAVAESGFIEAGERIKVLLVREKLLVVRATTEPLSPPENTNTPEKVQLDSESRATEKDQFDSESRATKQAGDERSLLDRPAEELGLDSLE